MVYRIFENQPVSFASDDDDELTDFGLLVANPDFDSMTDKSRQAENDLQRAVDVVLTGSYDHELIVDQHDCHSRPLYTIGVFLFYYNMHECIILLCVYILEE